MQNQKLSSKLKSESGDLFWHELERFYAQGIIRVIEKDNDLIDIAIALVENNTNKIEQNLKSTIISEPSSTQLRKWCQSRKKLLSIVITPFILIQEAP